MIHEGSQILLAGVDLAMPLEDYATLGLLQSEAVERAGPGPRGVAHKDERPGRVPHNPASAFTDIAHPIDIAKTKASYTCFLLFVVVCR